MGIFGAIAEGVVAIKYTANVDEAVAAVKGLSGEQKKAAKEAVEAHKKEREEFRKKVEEFGKGAAIIGGALLVARNREPDDGAWLAAMFAQMRDNHGTAEIEGDPVGHALADEEVGVHPRALLDLASHGRSASVERVFPNAVRVRILERKPLALWQRSNELVLVDEEGVAITADNLERFRKLLVIVGDDAPTHAGGLLSILAREPDLKEHVNAAVWVGDRRWNIRMNNGVFVRLPETDAIEAWTRFAKLERKHGLLKQDLLSIDLRIPDQLIVRTRAGKPEVGRKPGDRKGKST